VVAQPDPILGNMVLSTILCILSVFGTWGMLKRPKGQQSNDDYSGI